MKNVLKKCQRGLAFVLAFALVLSCVVKASPVQVSAATSNGLVMNVSDIEAATYSESFTYNGFTVNATSALTVTVDASNKSLGNNEYTKRLKTGGTGSAEAKSVKFTTTEATTLVMHAMASSTSATRTVGVATYDSSSKELKDVKTLSVGGSALSEYTVSLPDAGTYYIYSQSGGLNIYYLEVLSGGSGSGNEPAEKVDDEIREVAPDFKTGDLYASTKGTASGDGSFENPMDLVTAINQIPAGNTIWAFSGTYYLYDQYASTIEIPESNSGSENAYKTISSINGKPVTFNFIGMEEAGANRGFILDGSYWHFYDVDICNAGDNGMLLSGDNNILELCKFYKNHDSGLQLSRYNTSYTSVEQWPSNNLILNCTSYNNKDEATAENADGFAPKLTCGNGNVFDGCISYCNSDDGWDLYAKPETGSIGVVTLRNCVAFGNGKLTDGTGSANGDMNGFKLGGSNTACPTPHVVENCLAFYNGACGFTDNGNGGALKMTNCTSANNCIYENKANYSCYRTSADAEYTNIVSFADAIKGTDTFKGKLSHVLYAYKDVGYYWVNDWTCEDGSATKYSGSEASDYTVKADDFVNITVPGYSNGAYTADYHELFRNADGSVNVDGLFEIKESSTLYTAAKDGGYLGANFSEGAEISVKYAVTVQNDGKGTATASVPKAAEGATVTLTASPYIGFEFDKWEVISGEVTITNNSFVMPAGEVVVKAIFKEAGTGEDPIEPIDPIEPVEPVTDPVEAFVRRMYTVALGREADDAGVNNWVAALNAGTHDGAGIAEEFILREEFALRNLTDEQYVDTLYQTFFDRAADEGGKELWLAVLASGQTRGYVLSNFVNLPEFTMLCESYGIERGVMLESGVAVNPGIPQFVKRMYVVALGREAENDGLYNNVLALYVGAVTAEDVAKNFFTSDEYVMKGKDDAAYVTDLYAVFMGRDADESGLKFWTETIAVGMTRDEVLSEFAKSAEFKAIAASYGL